LKNQMVAILDAGGQGARGVPALDHGCFPDLACDRRRERLHRRDGRSGRRDIDLGAAARSTLQAAAEGDDDGRVATSTVAFNEAVAGSDPEAALAAEQRYAAAVLNRYNTEIQMVRQLQAAIDQLKEQAYQFQLSIAQRIVAAGGSRDIAGMSLSRAIELRGTIGGTANPGRQLQNLQGYVGAIDNWYQARRAAIERDTQAQQAAAQAIAQAQQSAIATQISGLQEQIALAQQWRGVLDNVSQLIDQMRLTGVNPLSASGRLGLAQGDAAAARALYLAATGDDKIGAVNKYIQALQNELGLLGDVYQRPSPEYQAIYNEIISQLTEVQGDAKTESERAVDLQQQVVSLQEQSNAIASGLAASMSVANTQLDALNAEYIGYMEFAEKEGDRLYALADPAAPGAARCHHRRHGRGALHRAAPGRGRGDHERDP
jgi:hypothetical protein